MKADHESDQTSDRRVFCGVSEKKPRKNAPPRQLCAFVSGRIGRDEVIKGSKFLFPCQSSAQG